MASETIYNVEIKLPKEPPKKEILFYEKKKKLQKWERTQLPENWEQLTEEEKYSFAIKDTDRRNNGIWFYNNGKSTYISGRHYYYLNWCKFNFGYPEYRAVDRLFFLYWDYVEKDPDCFGLIRLKFRRLGATSQGESIGLGIVTENYGVHCGIVSKTSKDASDAFEEVVDIFRNLPGFYQPMMEGKDRPKKALSFSEPASTLTKKHNKINKSLALGSKLDYRATDENAYDGRKLKYIMIDESGKWLEADFVKFWDVHKTCLMVGKNIIGKAYIPSTVNEMDGSGGKAFCDIWELSDASQRDKNGRTRSGLYRIFFPAYDGLEGFIDEYGESDTEGAKEYLNNIRESLKRDPDRLSEHIRQFPFTEDEAFYTKGGNNPFNKVKINQQLEHNRITLPVSPHLIVRGNFAWKDGVKDSIVEWLPNDQGKWLITWMPKHENQNKFKKVYGQKSPDNKDIGCFGLDPFDHNTTTSGKKSNAASYGFRKYDLVDSINSNMFVSEYINRPPLSEIMYEDMILQCVFYGWEILIENNKIGCLNYFRLRGYEGYLMERTQETHTDYSRRKQEEKGISTTGEEARQTIIDILHTYIHKNIGYDDESGQIGKCYFNALLLDWAKFDTKKWTDYDATVASALAIAGSRKFVQPKRDITVSINDLFKKYDNRGNESIAI